MSICSNVTEQDLINLSKLAEQHKNQRALEIKNRILKQTHDINLAENISLTTKKSIRSRRTYSKIRRNC